MSDDPDTQNPEQTPGPSANDAWSSVVTRMTELGAAISQWAKAAADDPENREKLEEFRAGVNDMARKADAAFSQVTATDVGRQFAEGAQQAGQAIGDAAQQVSKAAAPHVATAFAGLADMLGRAATRLDETANRDEKPDSTASAPPAEPSPTDDQT